jgi:colanic acid biosynthesis glycosyl transferase WcaI
MLGFVYGDEGSGPMRILIYSANFAPEPTGIGKYSGEMAEWLASHGHEVRVVAAPPYYPQWKVDAKYAKPYYRRETWQGVDVWRAPIWVPKSPTGLTRILHLFSFAVSSFPTMLRQVFWQPDLVIAVAPAFLCAPTAWLVARLSRARAWLHLQDFEVDVAFRMKLLKGQLLKRVVLRMERTVLRGFDSVSTISNRMVERLLTKGVSPSKSHYFPNWVDLSRFTASVVNGSRYRGELDIAEDALVVLFSGSLGGKQGLMVIPRAARILAHRKDIVFVVCGDGVMKSKVEAASADLPNMRLLPLQPSKRLAELLGMADVHLLTQNPNAEDLVLPSKLSGMLASGRPVIATCRRGTEISEVVARCGLVVEPQDENALANAILRLAGNRDICSEMGRRAREFAEVNFERDAVLGRVFGPLEGDLSDAVDNVAV